MKNNYRKAYMCEVDYLYELGDAEGGSTLYPDLEDLKKHHTCWEGCGIVEVEVKKTKVVSSANWKKQKVISMKEYASQEQELRVKWLKETIKRQKADLKMNKERLEKLVKELK